MKVEIFLDVPEYATKSDDCFANTFRSALIGGSKRYKITVDVDRPAEGEPIEPTSVEDVTDENL
jgi:hypothetical protein